MRVVLWLLVLVFAFPLFADDKKAETKKADTKKVEKKSTDSKKTEDNKTFEEKGRFSVGVPEGFEWKKLQDINSGKTTGTSYICRSRKTTNSVILAFLNLNAKTDQGKKDFVAGQFDGFKNDFENRSGGRIIEGEVPKLESNVPDQVSYSLKLQNANKSEFYQNVTVVFGKHVFSVTAHSLKSDEAKALNEEVVKSLKELDK